jgi:hypothetical protein
MSSSVSWLRGLSRMDRNDVVAAFMASDCGEDLARRSAPVIFGTVWGLMCWEKWEKVCNCVVREREREKERRVRERERVSVGMGGAGRGWCEKEREKEGAASLLFARGFLEARMHPRLPRSVAVSIIMD